MIGADLYRVTALDVPVLSGASAPPYRWSWRRNGLVRGLWLGTLSGLPADAGGLRLDIQIKSEHYAGDGTQVRELTALASSSYNDWFDLGDIPVHTNDPWILTVRNAGPNTVIPVVAFFVRPEVNA